MSPLQKILFVAMALCWLAGGVVWAAVSDRAGRKFHHDFRGKPIPGILTLAGPEANRFIRSEPEGLRITLPKNRSNLEQVGFFLHWSLAGDFEADATFEILNVEIPDFGYGAGFSIGVDDLARIGRLARPPGNQVVFWDHWPTIDGERKHFFKFLPSDARRGRLRLRRENKVLHFLWSPEIAEERFFEIHRVQFGEEETKFFTFMASSSEAPALVDVRLLEFAVHPINVPPNHLVWVAALLGLTGTGCAAGLGVSLLVRGSVASKSK